MNRRILTGILLVTLLLSMLPLVSAVGGIVISAPSGETYSRGDDVTITATSYAADSIWTIQIQRSSTIVWVDQKTSAGSLSYKFTIPSSWSGGTYTIYVDGQNSDPVSTTFVLSVPTVLLPISTPTTTTPTVAEVQAMTTTQAASTVAQQTTQTAAKIVTGLTTQKAVAVVAKLNDTFVEKIFEKGAAAGNQSKIAEIANQLDADRAADILLEVDPESGASIVEEMTKNDLNAAALRVEEAVKRSGNAARLQEFGGSLAGVSAETLVSLFREIAGLPATPSTVAALFEVMEITKVIDIVDAWMETESYEDLALVYSYLSEEKLGEIFLTMSGEQRTAIYPYLDEVTQAKLPELGALAVSSLSIVPSSGVEGTVFTISVSVSNDGLIEFTEGVTLRIDGSAVESEMVTLMPDATATLTWTVSEADPGTYAVSVNGLTGSFTVEAAPVLEPADIEYLSVSVSPSIVEEGDTVSVTVNLRNNGDETGAEEVELLVNDAVVDSETVSVTGGETETVSFSIVGGVPGTYTVKAGGKSASFTVSEPETPPTSSNWMYIIGAVVLVAAVAVYYYMQQKKQ